MLSVFPDLLTYVLLAPFILRIALGGFFIFAGIRKQKEENAFWNNVIPNINLGFVKLSTVLIYLQIISGIFLIIGLFTQVVALIVSIFICFEWYKKNRFLSLAFPELWTLVFALIIAISLLFTGAGFLAFDLPL